MIGGGLLLTGGGVGCHILDRLGAVLARSIGDLRGAQALLCGAGNPGGLPHNP